MPTSKKKKLGTGHKSKPSRRASPAPKRKIPAPKKAIKKRTPAKRAPSKSQARILLKKKLARIAEQKRAASLAKRRATLAKKKKLERAAQKKREGRNARRRVLYSERRDLRKFRHYLLGEAPGSTLERVTGRTRDGWYLLKNMIANHDNRWRSFENMGTSLGFTHDEIADTWFSPKVR